MRSPLFFLLAGCTTALGALYEKFDDLPKLNFDFIIIGGGTAGNVLANRLTENPNISVLLLEAGASTADVLISQVPFYSPLASAGNTSIDWNFTTTAQSGLNGRSIAYARGFGLGGSSAINYMLYTRGSYQDYDRYARVTGDDGWSWDALEPYILKSEGFTSPVDHHNITGEFTPEDHGFDGLLSVTLPGYPRSTDSRMIQATADLPDEFPFNQDYNSGHHLGIGWEQSTVHNGTRSSSETAFLGPKYLSRPNLHVLIHSYVTRILESNCTTKGVKTFDTVEFTQDAGETIYTLSPTKEIILSAGSIGTPHILLYSGIGDADELTSVGITPTVHLQDVGKNLTDHPRYALAWTVNSTDTIENVYLRNETFQEEALAEWEANRTGYIASTSGNQLGFLRAPDGLLDDEPCSGDETAHFEFVFSNGIPQEPIPPTGNYFTILAIVVCPLARGHITINSTNPLDPPLINPNLLGHPQDLTIMQAAINASQRFVAASAWDDYILEFVSNTTEAAIRDGADTLWHPVGTASMSPRHADWGVVDPDLKMKGLKGVRIVDASVFPYVPAANTQAAVYAFAERAADLIKRDYVKKH
ncbi:alcohol oxidase [Armillaria novae-zelandiae]|uniref:Alcohol oxidase n=1 Tax=Armillaria novae-zelandiae TaxID=153914 RepID=A0AA39P5E8_9AGAR|nr:alcohol oxidase [Armillaria novae-zelandiae]